MLQSFLDVKIGQSGLPPGLECQQDGATIWINMDVLSRILSGRPDRERPAALEALNSYGRSSHSVRRDAAACQSNAERAM